MILIDANLLLYAYDAKSPSHDAARAWLEKVLNGPEPVRIGLITLLAFVRLSSNPSLFAEPMSAPDAVSVVRSWLTRPNVAVADVTARHWDLLTDLASKAKVRGPRMMDAHLAALAIAHGATLFSADRDFARFPGLRWKDPIAS